MATVVVQVLSKSPSSRTVDRWTSHQGVVPSPKARLLKHDCPRIIGIGVCVVVMFSPCSVSFVFIMILSAKTSPDTYLTSDYDQVTKRGGFGCNRY